MCIVLYYTVCLVSIDSVYLANISLTLYIPLIEVVYNIDAPLLAINHITYL
jgi:hypothetical protein